MRVFDSRHYILEGYRKIVIQDEEVFVWVIQSRPNPKFPNDGITRILVKEAKFVDNGVVSFLKGDGRIEDRSRSPHKLATCESR